MTVTPATEDLIVYQGQAWTQNLLWKDATDTPIPLAGWTARMQVRKRVDAPDVIISLTTENGRIVLGPGDGEIALILTAAETAALPATVSNRKWRYDLELVPAGGQTRRLMMGKFAVSLEVTRG